MDHYGFERWVTLFIGVWRAIRAQTLLRLVSNQVHRDLEAAREGGGGTVKAFRSVSRAGHSVRAQLGVGPALRNNPGCRRMRMGMWSDAVAGRVSDDSAN